MNNTKTTLYLGLGLLILSAAPAFAAEDISTKEVACACYEGTWARCNETVIPGEHERYVQELKDLTASRQEIYARGEKLDSAKEKACKGRQETDRKLMQQLEECLAQSTNAAETLREVSQGFQPDLERFENDRKTAEEELEQVTLEWDSTFPRMSERLHKICALQLFYQKQQADLQEALRATLEASLQLPGLYKVLYDYRGDLGSLRFNRWCDHYYKDTRPQTYELQPLHNPVRKLQVTLYSLVWEYLKAGDNGSDRLYTVLTSKGVTPTEDDLAYVAYQGDCTSFYRFLALMETPKAWNEQLDEYTDRLIESLREKAFAAIWNKSYVGKKYIDDYDKNMARNKARLQIPSPLELARSTGSEELVAWLEKKELQQK